MYTYQYVIDPFTGLVSTQQIKRITLSNGAISFVPNNPMNKDWRAYQTWLAAGNTPLAVDAVYTPPGS
jgi:hypothetical protein